MLVRNGAKDVLIVGVGSMAATAVEVAERLVAQGIGVTVVDPRWVKPVDPALVDLAREHRLVVSIEDNGRVGGCGSVLLQTLNDAGVDDAVPAARHPAGVPRPRQAPGDPRADRAHRPDPRARHRRAAGRRGPPAAPDHRARHPGLVPERRSPGDRDLGVGPDVRRRQAHAFVDT